MLHLAALRRFGFTSPVRTAALNTAGAAVFNQAMLIVSGALSARILGPTDRGHAALLVLVPSVLSIAGSFGFASAVRFFIAKEPAYTRQVLSSIKRDLTLQLILLVTIHIVLTLTWLMPSLDQSSRVAALIALAAVPASFVTGYGMAVLQGHQRFLAFTVILVAPQFIYSSGVVILYISGSGGLVLVVLANVIAAVISSVAVILASRRSMVAEPHGQKAPSRHQIRKFARKSYFGQVAPIESFRLDQLAVGTALTPTVLGYYTVATAFTNLSRFLGDSMGYVLGPHIASLPAHRQRKSLIRGLLFTAFICGTVSFTLIPLSEVVVPLLFGNAFRPAIPLAQILLIGGFLLGVRRAVLPGLQGIGHPEIGSYSEFVALLVFAALLPVALQYASGSGVAAVFLASAVVALASIVVLFHLRVGRSVPTGANGGPRAGP